MNKEQTITKLKELKDSGDNEVVHILTDEILLEFVDPDVKKIYLELKEKVGFWYA